MLRLAGSARFSRCNPKRSFLRQDRAGGRIVRIMAKFPSASAGETFDRRDRAVLLMVAVLVGMGALRLWTPGRPWFASRARLMDVAVYVILAAIIWWFAPYVSTLAVR